MSYLIQYQKLIYHSVITMEKNNTPPATDFLESAKTFGIKALSLILSAFMLWEMMSIAYSYIILPAIFAFSVIAVGYIMLTDEAFQSFREK
ncbi:MAG: hypothetical protein FJ161_03615, partial [Gammaproteobacteria bacterium]|nr:hypothetical protein [Gammaproteobacteria bacterium]